MHLQRARKDETAKAEQATSVRTKGVDDQFAMERFQQKNLCHFRKGNVQPAEQSHVMPAATLPVGIEEQHIDGRISHHFQDEVRIQRARDHLELRTMAQGASKKLQLHLAGIGHENIDWSMHRVPHREGALKVQVLHSAAIVGSRRNKSWSLVTGFRDVSHIEPLHDPEVTVLLKDFERSYFIASGEVTRPGKYELHGPTTVTTAVAMAGGFTQQSKHSPPLEAPGAWLSFALRFRGSPEFGDFAFSIYNQRLATRVETTVSARDRGEAALRGAH